MMLKKVLATGMAVFISFALCSCGDSERNIIDKQIETVVVKETVYVTEANQNNEVYYNEPSEPNQYEEETRENKKGYTTADILRKAEEAADKQYWILYYCDNKLRMQSFNALEGFTVTLESDQHLKCDRLVGDVILYFWDEEKSDFSITNSTAYSDWKCNSIIGGNVDIIDEKNDTIISAKTE